MGRYKAAGYFGRVLHHAATLAAGLGTENFGVPGKIDSRSSKCLFVNRAGCDTINTPLHCPFNRELNVVVAGLARCCRDVAGMEAVRNHIAKINECGTIDRLPIGCGQF